MDVSEILDKLDDHGFEDITTADKMDMLNAVYHDITSREPWVFLDNEVTITAGAGNNQYSTTTGKVRIDDMRSVLSIVDVTNGTKLAWVRNDAHLKANATQLSKTGDPYQYMFKGLGLYLYPLPQSGSFVVYYQKIPADLLSTDVETSIVLPARHHWALVLGTLIKLYMMDDDVDAAQGQQSLYEQQIIQMRQDLWKQQWDRPDNILMSDEEMYDTWDF